MPLKQEIFCKILHSSVIICETYENEYKYELYYASCGSELDVSVLNRSVEATFSGTRGKKCGKCLKKNLSYVAVA